MSISLRLAAVLPVVLSLPAGPPAAAAGAAERGPAAISVLTQNQYLGADLAPLVATSPSDANAALLDVLEQIAASDFPARVQRQAQAIARQRPDLVGLQEVETFGCIDPDPAPPPQQGCDDPLVAGALVDFLALTLDALAARGADYRAVAAVGNFDTRGIEVTLDDGSRIALPGLPVEIDGRVVFITAFDRDVILARARTVERVAPVEFPAVACRRSLDGCNYAAVAPVELAVPGGVAHLVFERGFVGVDAKVRGDRFRFVDTHLEVAEPAPDVPASAFFQSAQAAQLIALLEATTSASRRLIVAGDINSSPDDQPVPGPLPDLPPPFDQGLVPPYQQFVAAGLLDAWTVRPRRDPGFTCCQAPDLMNEVSLLDQRVDVVFADATLARARTQLVGDRPRSRTRSGLWPSDHAALVARLLFRPEGMTLAAAR